MERLTTVEENRHYGLSEVDIMYFLSHLRNGNLDDMEYRQLLINAMVNSIYVYSDEEGDHKITVIFNVSNQTPIQVDVSLLDEIRVNGGSYASPSSPPDKGSRF